jgi:hypothetical protein
MSQAIKRTVSLAIEGLVVWLKIGAYSAIVTAVILTVSIWKSSPGVALALLFVLSLFGAGLYVIATVVRR